MSENAVSVGDADIGGRMETGEVNAVSPEESVLAASVLNEVEGKGENIEVSLAVVTAESLDFIARYV